MNPEESANTKINVHVQPNMQYTYHDIFNLHVGEDEVVIEFGTRLRSAENEAIINHGVVMSLSNAIHLQQLLQQTITKMQQEFYKKNKQQEPS
jgi:hypothetical protein